jgi:hypothetical protein
MASGRSLRAMARRARAGGGDHALEAGFTGKVEQDRGESDVVLDDQHEGIVAEIVAIVAYTSSVVGIADGTVAPLFS